jgi:hypothetical protein
MKPLRITVGIAMPAQALNLLVFVFQLPLWPLGKVFHIASAKGIPTFTILYLQLH